MFKFQNYEVRFHHKFDPSEDTYPLTNYVSKSEIKRAIHGGILPKYKATTVCTILDDAGYSYVGFSNCSWLDRFDRQKALELSFGRAIQTFVPKQERLQWWTEFAKHHKRDMGMLSKNSKMVLSGPGGLHHG